MHDYGRKRNCLPFCWIFLVLLVTSSCQKEDISPQVAWEEINGRDEGTSLERQPVYRVKVPLSWKRIDPTPLDSIADTRLPLVEYLISPIHITIHNFPIDEIEARISPISQVTRWQKQFQEVDTASVRTKPQAFSGFVGIRFEAIGIQHEKETMYLAWALQMGDAHLLELTDRQKRGDVTIKVVGPPSAIKSHLSEIEAFARSFELIDEIPVRQ